MYRTGCGILKTIQTLFWGLVRRIFQGSIPRSHHNPACSSTKGGDGAGVGGALPHLVAIVRGDELRRALDRAPAQVLGLSMKQTAGFRPGGFFTTI